MFLLFLGNDMNKNLTFKDPDTFEKTNPTPNVFADGTNCYCGKSSPLIDSNEFSRSFPFTNSFKCI